MLVGGNAVSSASTCSPSHLVTITIPSDGDIPAQWLNYSGPPRANVLLPACYNPSQRYPLLVMLNGLSQNYNDYVTEGLIPAFDGLNAIVVMPEGGSGWYADWWNDGQRGDPAWESYELNKVIPTILARYPILPQRQYHAIGGLSMGGLGATYLGGRLPGFFGSVASLSGFVDLKWNSLNHNSPVAPTLVDLAMGLTSQPAVNELIDGGIPTLETVLAGDYKLYPVLGPPDGFYFDGHNPTSLAMNLQQTRVFESTGTGFPSSAGLAAIKASPASAEGIAVGSAEESAIIYPMNDGYHTALTGAGVDVTFQVHSGGHDNPDFMNEIKAMVAWGLFKPVNTHPTSWANDTVATSGQLWDISYRFDQPPSQVVQFRQKGNSLSISAAGSDVTIRTNRGCVIKTTTPATIQILSGNCR
ncbi:MAG: alpha/beta hydrolase [Acidimicrobiales bacterium]